MLLINLLNSTEQPMTPVAPASWNRLGGFVSILIPLKWSNCSSALRTPPELPRGRSLKKNCFLTFHMSGWCQTLLLDSQKSLLFLCKREVLSRRECFRTLIYLEMTQLFSTLSSLSLAQDRNSGNQNTWRNDCMFSSVQWLSRV